MPEGTLCVQSIRGVVHEGRPATAQGWRYRMFYPSPMLIAHALREPAALCPQWRMGPCASHVMDDRELYREFVSLHMSSQLGETLLERQTRIASFLRRLFERHGNFSPERSRRANCAPHGGDRSRLPSRAWPKASQPSPTSHRRQAFLLRRSSVPFSGNRHAAAFLPRQLAGRTGKGVVTSGNRFGRGGA